MARLEFDELVEHFTLLPHEVELLGDKSGASRLGFAHRTPATAVHAARRRRALRRCRSPVIERDDHDGYLVCGAGQQTLRADPAPCGSSSDR